jgi:hypothetical protein
LRLALSLTKVTHDAIHTMDQRQFLHRPRLDFLCKLPTKMLPPEGGTGSALIIERRLM